MAKMMTFFAFSCLFHHRGVNGYAGTPTPGDSTLGTLSQDISPRSESICPVEHRVLVRRDGGPIVPPPPDSRDLVAKFGVQAPAKDFEAMLLGPNPTPGDSDQVMLSKDRSPRSESICLVE